MPEGENPFGKGEEEEKLTYVKCPLWAQKCVKRGRRALGSLPTGTHRLEATRDSIGTSWAELQSREASPLGLGTGWLSGGRGLFLWAFKEGEEFLSG